MSAKLTKVSPNEYTKWLINYLLYDNLPSDYYDYSVNQRMLDLYIANKNFVPIPLCGSSAINIIIPKGIELLGVDMEKANLISQIGHCNIYFEDSNIKPIGSVPIFEDIVRILKDSIPLLYKKILPFLEEAEQSERDSAMRLSSYDEEHRKQQRDLEDLLSKV